MPKTPKLKKPKYPKYPISERIMTSLAETIARMVKEKEQADERCQVRKLPAPPSDKEKRT